MIGTQERRKEGWWDKSLKWGIPNTEQNGEGSSGRPKLMTEAPPQVSHFLLMLGFCLFAHRHMAALPAWHLVTNQHLGAISQVTLAPYAAAHNLCLFHPHSTQVLGSQVSQKKCYFYSPVVKYKGWRWAMGSSPRSSTFQLCHCKQLLNFFVPWFHL